MLGCFVLALGVGGVQAACGGGGAAPSSPSQATHLGGRRPRQGCRRGSWYRVQGFVRLGGGRRRAVQGWGAARRPRLAAAVGLGAGRGGRGLALKLLKAVLIVLGVGKAAGVSTHQLRRGVLRAEGARVGGMASMG